MYEIVAPGGNQAAQKLKLPFSDRDQYIGNSKCMRQERGIKKLPKQIYQCDQRSLTVTCKGMGKMSLTRSKQLEEGQMKHLLIGEGGHVNYSNSTKVRR